MKILFVGMLLASSTFAMAHDRNLPELDGWFESLRATSGSFCCKVHEAKQLEDGDWDTKDGHYRVRLNGQWFNVPPGAVVNEKNLVGTALVWATLNGPRPSIRCFLPGTWS